MHMINNGPTLLFQNIQYKYAKVQHKTFNKSQLWELIMMYMIYANIYTFTQELKVNIQYLTDNFANRIEVISFNY